MSVVMQAIDSGTSEKYTWSASAYDAGSSYPGPNSPTNIIVIAGMGPGRSGGASGAIVDALYNASLITTVAESGLPNSHPLSVGTDPDGYGPGGLRFGVDGAGVAHLDAPFLDAPASTPVVSTSDQTIGTLDFYARGDHSHALSESLVRHCLAQSAGAVSVNAQVLSNVASPVASSDAANKAYVDLHAAGIIAHASVEAMAVGNIASMSGLAVTADGVALQYVGMRVLCVGQSTGSQNGYWITAAGAWTRASDLPAGSHSAGAYAVIKAGTIYGGTGWICNSAAGSDLVGTDALTFAQFTAANTVLAGNGLVRTGNILDVVADADGSIIVSADAIKVGVINAAQHGTLIGGNAHAMATSSAAGFMTAAMVSKLAGIDSGANATPDATSSVKGKLQLSGDIGGTADIPLVKRINGAIAPGYPGSSADVLKIVGVSGVGQYDILDPTAFNVLTQTNINTTVVEARNVRTDIDGFRVIDCRFWFELGLVYGNDDTLVISGSKWGAIGLLSSFATTAGVHVSVETEHNNSSGSCVRQVFRGHLNANRLSSSNWGVNSDLAESTGEKWPSAAGGSVTMSMAVGGTQNGDITITVHPLNSNANQSAFGAVVRIYGGSRIAL